MPSPAEALPCGSRSTISTRSPIAANAVPSLIAVLRLPTPPCGLASARIRGRPGVAPYLLDKSDQLRAGAGAMGFSGLIARLDMVEFHDPVLSAGAAGME